MSLSRRRLFGLLAGVAALPVLKKFPLSKRPVKFNWSGYETSIPNEVFATNPIMAELTAITRVAFVPRIATEIYSHNLPLPFMTKLEEENADAR